MRVEQIGQENVKMLSEVNMSLLKIKRKVKELNSKLEEHNNKHNNKEFYVVEKNAQKKKDNK